jgi:hypothetical protein
MNRMSIATAVVVLASCNGPSGGGESGTRAVTNALEAPAKGVAASDPSVQATSSASGGVAVGSVQAPKTQAARPAFVATNEVSPCGEAGCPVGTVCALPCCAGVCAPPEVDGGCRPGLISAPCGFGRLGCSCVAEAPRCVSPGDGGCPSVCRDICDTLKPGIARCLCP